MDGRPDDRSAAERAAGSQWFPSPGTERSLVGRGAGGEGGRKRWQASNASIASTAARSQWATRTCP